LKNGNDVQALKDLGAFAGELPHFLEKCVTYYEDMQLLQNFTAFIEKEIANPKSFVFHALESLVINHAEIESKMSDIVVNYDAGDYFNLGIDIGGLLSETTLGSEANHTHAIVMTNRTRFDKSYVNYSKHYLDDELWTEQFERMDSRDNASYRFLLGFVEKAKDLSKKKEELDKNEHLNMSKYEFSFNKTYGFIFKPI